MTGKYQVDLQALKGHEPEVRGTADKVHEAIDATGAAQGLGDLNAFGLVGQVVALGVEYWIHSATSFVKGLGDAGHDLADKVGSAHEAMQNHEDTSKAKLAALGKEIQA
ncbi:type VII secretion target [Amycolatopsis alkalitolerans]|nr:type VII secretion target [Amycolatopsis alkalitolerans]